MAEILNLPPNLPKSQNAEVGASKFCPGCGHGITLKALANAVDDLEHAKIAFDTLKQFDAFNISQFAWEKYCQQLIV